MIIFQIITASFLAVALMAAVLPFRYNIFLKKSARCVSIKLLIALAAFRKAIYKRLLPFGSLLLMDFAARFFIVGCQPQPAGEVFGCIKLLKAVGPYFR